MEKWEVVTYMEVRGVRVELATDGRRWRVRQHAWPGYEAVGLKYVWKEYGLKSDADREIERLEEALVRLAGTHLSEV